MFFFLVLSSVTFNFLFVPLLFQYPSLESVHDIKAHTTDVDDLDVHPNSRQVSVFIPNLEYPVTDRDDQELFWIRQCSSQPIKDFFHISFLVFMSVFYSICIVTTGSRIRKIN